MFSEEYYNNSNKWGSSLPSLKDVILEVVQDAEEHASIFRNTTRESLIRYAKRGLSELFRSFKEQIKGVEITVPASVTIPLFEDFNSLVRASVIECGELYPIFENKNLPNSIERYLQQCNGEVVFNPNTKEVYTIGDSLNCLDCKDNSNIECNDDCYNLCFIDPCDNSKTKKYAKEYIHLLKNPSRFGFSDGLEGKQVLIEYLPELVYGYDECEILINPEWTEMLIHYIKFRALEHNQQYLNFFQYHKREYQIAKKNLVSNNLDVNIDNIIKILKA